MLERLRFLLRPRAADRDFDQELEAHLEMLAEDYTRRGLSPEEARRRARVELGGRTQLREAHRAVRGLPFLDTCGQDVRYALRGVRKNPGFTAMAVLTLAMGIGVNTAVFTAFDALALRPLQARDPGHVVQVSRADRNPSFTYADYTWYRDHNRSFFRTGRHGGGYVFHE